MAGGKRDNANTALMLALATGATIEAAAASAGIGVATAHRRLKNLAFRRKLEAFRQRMIQQLAGKLVATATESIERLREVQNDEEAPPASRVAAASQILSQTMKYYEAHNLAARIEIIEQRLHANEQQKKR